MSSRAEDARTILSIPLFTEVLKELEASAVDHAVGAAYDNHEARLGRMADIRAIRDLRSRIEVISKEDQAIERKKAPA